MHIVVNIVILVGFHTFSSYSSKRAMLCMRAFLLESLEELKQESV